MSVCAAYFGDELAVDFVHNADVSQRGLQLAFQLLGALRKPQNLLRLVKPNVHQCHGDHGNSESNPSDGGRCLKLTTRLSSGTFFDLRTSLVFWSTWTVGDLIDSGWYDKFIKDDLPSWSVCLYHDLNPVLFHSTVYTCPCLLKRGRSSI